MTRRVTTLLAMFVLILGTGTAFAQTEVTIRDINHIPDADIAAVDALDENLTEDNIESLIRSEWTDSTVTFQAVVLANPRYSGLSSYNSSRGGPSRVHYFVRDTSAVSMGAEGMDMQVVDGNWDTSGSINLFEGDVVEMTGVVAYFGTGIQFSPETITVLGTTADLGIPDSVMDPVSVTIADIQDLLDPDNNLVQANWTNFSALNNTYVRIEGVEVWRSPNRSDDRPNWALRDRATGHIIQNDDISLAFRNDRTQYPDIFNVENDFTAPPPGATVNIQGFALLRSDFDPFNIGAPAAGMMKITPWVDSDLVVTASPPDIQHTERPNTVPNTTNGVDLLADITVDPSATLASAEVVFTTTSNSTEQTSPGSQVDGSTYTFTIPPDALQDGDFITYWFRATDSSGSTSETISWELRVLNNGITSIAQIQETSDGGPGDSPFVDMLVDMDITATVQTSAAAGFIAIQDDENAGAWSGIFIDDVLDSAMTDTLESGDVINITRARVVEIFDVTNLDLADLEFTAASSGGAVIAPKVVTTDILQDEAIAEAHEGIVLQFNDPVVTEIHSFGEMSVSTDGTAENGVRIDDASDLFPSGYDPGAEFSVGERLEYVIGPMWYSFGDYKLAPESLDSFGPVTNVATEDETVPESFTLHQNYPNPFNPETNIRYELDTTGNVQLQVFDVLGRPVATLVDGNQTAGTHTVTFDAGTLSSGMYIYRLTANGQTLSRTMLLLK